MEFADLEHPITATAVRFAPGQRSRYVPNRRSFGAFMRSDQMRDVTADVADDIALLAAQAVPESSPGPRGGNREKTGLHSRVKRGFKVQRGRGYMKINGNLRVKVLVVNNAPRSALLEFGGRGLPRLRMLGRAGATFGDFKPEGGPS